MAPADSMFDTVFYYKAVCKILFFALLFVYIYYFNMVNQVL